MPTTVLILTELLMLLLVLPINTAGSSDGELDELFEEFWDWKMLDIPEVMSHKGLHKHDDLLTSYSIDNFDDKKMKVEYFRNKLKGISYQNLSEKQIIEYDIFDDYISTFIDGYDWRDYQSLTPVHFIGGLQTNPQNFINRAKFISRGDFENYVARLEALPNQIDDIKQSLNRAVEVRHTFHLVSMEKVPGQIRRYLKGNPIELIFYKPFNETLEKVPWIPETAKSDLRRRGKYACSEIVNSWQSLSDFIENVYLKHTRPTYGVNGWDNGDEFYKACLKWHLSVDLSPEEVHNIGLNEVSKTVSQMQKIFDKLGHKGNIREFFASLKNDSRFFRQTKEELISVYRNIADERIAPALQKAFNNIPDAPLRIKPLTYDGPTALYRSGSADGSRPGTFYVNLNRPSTHMIFTFMALTLHEGNPGHHMQLTILSHLNIPKYRRYLSMSDYYKPPFQFPFYTAYVEGWGLYSENLGEEIGLYKDDYEMMGVYSADIFRSCRLVVDTGLHYFNWSRERAIEYMVNYTAIPTKQIEIEVDRYITYPGQACAYKIGELKIKEIREKAKTILGDRFNLKEFHDVFLNNGPMPLRILEQLFDKWIHRVKEGKLSSEDVCSSAIKLSLDVLSCILPILFMYCLH